MIKARKCLTVGLIAATFAAGIAAATPALARAVVVGATVVYGHVGWGGGGYRRVGWGGGWGYAATAVAGVIRAGATAAMTTESILQARRSAPWRLGRLQPGRLNRIHTITAPAIQSPNTIMVPSDAPVIERGAPASEPNGMLWKDMYKSARLANELALGATHALAPPQPH